MLYSFNFYGYYTGNCVNMQVKKVKFKKSSEESIKLKRNEQKGEIQTIKRRPWKRWVMENMRSALRRDCGLEIAVSLMWKNMLQIKRGGCEDYISAESLVERIHGLPVKSIEFITEEDQRKDAWSRILHRTLRVQRWKFRRHLVSRPAPSDVLLGLQYNICLFRAIP